MANIDFSLFQQLELRIGEITDVQEVAGSSKLYKIMLAMGNGETRQILSGIKKYMTPDFLIGKQVLILVNLEPKVMAGELSNGMILMAIGDGDRPILLSPIEKIPNGSGVC